MDKSIKDIVEELQVEIVYNPLLDDAGHYVPEYNLILINSNLDEFFMTKTLLHELGHAAQHQGNQSLYNATFVMHSKMENEAEEFMVKHLVRQYMDLIDADPSAVNYMNFIESNELDVSMEELVKEAFLEYGQ